MSGTTRTRERPRHCLAAVSLHRHKPADFYSRHTPTLRHFNHLADHPREQHGDQAPGITPATAALPGLVVSFVRSVTSLAGVTPRVIVARLRLPPERSFRAEDCSISAGRNEKHPLTHRRWFFAVRQRLRSNLLASPRGPFMVELFAALGFAQGPRTRSQVRSRASPRRELPTPAEVERA